MPLPIAWPASLGLRLPIRSPTRMVMPMDKPVMTIVIVCKSILPTPDTSAVSANCPTTSRSTPPYKACKNSVKSTGTAKRTRETSIFPSVKECFFSIMFFLLFHSYKSAVPGVHAWSAAKQKEPDKEQIFQSAALSGSSFHPNDLPSEQALFIIADNDFMSRFFICCNNRCNNKDGHGCCNSSCHD